MKIALINPPQRGEKFFAKPSFPLGLGYIKAMCKKNGLNCDLFDLSQTNSSNNELCERYKFDSYDCIGLSTYTVSFKDTINLVQTIKTQNNIVVLGGHHASLLRNKILEDFDCVDFVLAGYGEQSFVDFILKQRTEALYEIQGLCYRKDGLIFNNEFHYDQYVVEEFPYPDYEDIVYDCPVYENKSTELLISTSRGCPFKCSFCVNCKRDFWTARNADNVISEISFHQRKTNFDTVNFVDCNFFVNPKRATAIIEGINDLLPNIKIIAQIRSDQVVKNELLINELLRKFNLTLLMGIESNSVKVLSRYQKGTSPEINQKAVDILKLSGDTIIIYMIMFDSLTTIDDVRLSFDFMKNNNLFKFQNCQNLYQSIMPFFDTDYFEKYKEYYKVDIHDISVPNYLDERISILKNCYDCFIEEYDDRIKDKIYRYFFDKAKIEVADFLFLEQIYFYVFELFLILLEKVGYANYNFFRTTSLSDKLRNILLKYEHPNLKKEIKMK